MMNKARSSRSPVGCRQRFFSHAEPARLAYGRLYKIEQLFSRPGASLSRAAFFSAANDGRTAIRSGQFCTDGRSPAAIGWNPDLVHAVRRVRAGDSQGIREPREGVMSGESLLIILVVGLIAGWLAGQIVQGTGFGLVGDLIIGVVGAFIGGWLLPQLGIHLGSGIIAAIINATIGAVVLLLIIKLVRGGGGWGSSWGGGWGNRWGRR